MKGKSCMTNDFVVKSGGFAFEVPSSHKFRFDLIEGQQILDVAIWCKEEPTKEFLSMHQTIFMNGRKITKGSLLYSDYIVRRVIAECIEETEYESSKEGYFHHSVMGYCDDVETQTNRSCKTNFLNSISKFGLEVENLNDNTINLFEKFTCTPDGNLLHYSSDAKKGDYITFLSHVDLLVSVSLCPSVDLTEEVYENCNVKPNIPIKISIYE